MDSRVNCLPVYIVIDTSASMRPFEYLLNESVESLYDELITSPRISEFAYVSILSYNTDARVIMQMTDIQSMTALPRLQCAGVTDFRKAVRLLRTCIDADVPALNAEGRHVLRPVAFLLTDGQPTDETGHYSDNWKADFEELVGQSYRRHPNIVPFGYGDATPEMLRAVSTIKDAAFLAKEGGTGDALKRVIPALLNTLVASARDNELRLPAEVEGFIRVTPEMVE